MKESTIQMQIINYLSKIAIQKNIFYFAPLNETAMMILKAFKVPSSICAKIINFLKKMGLMVGTPDIIVYLPNSKVINFEVKNEKGTLSDSQTKIHAYLKKINHKVFVVRSLEEFISILELHND
jgi:hypothetical protein